MGALAITVLPRAARWKMADAPIVATAPGPDSPAWPWCSGRPPPWPMSVLVPGWLATVRRPRSRAHRPAPKLSPTAGRHRVSHAGRRPVSRSRRPTRPPPHRRSLRGPNGSGELAPFICCSPNESSSRANPVPRTSPLMDTHVGTARVILGCRYAAEAEHDGRGNGGASARPLIADSPGCRTLHGKSADRSCPSAECSARPVRSRSRERSALRNPSVASLSSRRHHDVRANLSNQGCLPVRGAQVPGGTVKIRRNF
jgi:hypothetical protein